MNIERSVYRYGEGKRKERIQIWRGKDKGLPMLRRTIEEEALELFTVSIAIVGV